MKNTIVITAFIFTVSSLFSLTDITADQVLNKKSDQTADLALNTKNDLTNDIVFNKNADPTTDLITEAKNKTEAVNLIREAETALTEASKLIRLSELGDKLENKFFYTPKFSDNSSDSKLTAVELEKYKNSYDEALFQSINILEKAKESFFSRQYKYAKSYIDIIFKILDKYKSSTGIKTFYTVKSKDRNTDCLWRIAGYDFIYNNPVKWPLIWKANKDIINDPEKIFPGQKLIIPEINKP